MIVRCCPMMMSLLVLAMAGCSSTKEPVPQQPVSEARDAGDMRPGAGGGRRRRGGDQPDDTNQLKVGDVAPTFKLKSLDNKEETDLASFKGRTPVVLFFGSYT